MPDARRPEFPSVGRKLVAPELESDFSNLVTCLLAQRVRGVEVIVTAAFEHLEFFDNGPAKEIDSGEIFLVLMAYRCGRLERADPRLGPPISGQRLVRPGLQRPPVPTVDVVEHLPQASP